MKYSVDKLLFLDLETTGLDSKNNYILELGAIVTDMHLNELNRVQFLIYYSHLDRIFEEMDDFCQNMHTENKLMADLYSYKSFLEDSGEPRADLAGWYGLLAVQRKLLDFINRNFDKPVILAGDSVHFDKSFLKEQMPEVHAKLSHRIVDTSSFRIMYEGMCNIVPPKKKTVHRVMSDCEDSIQKLKFFMSKVSV